MAGSSFLGYRDAPNARRAGQGTSTEDAAGRIIWDLPRRHRAPAQRVHLADHMKRYPQQEVTKIRYSH